MKKLRIEDLQVDTFVTSHGGEFRGTVAGHDSMPTAGCPTLNAACINSDMNGTCDTCGPNCTDGGTASDDGFCPTGGCANSINICPTAGSTCNGYTNCGTCAGAATCDLQEGCGGTSFDLQIC